MGKSRVGERYSVSIGLLKPGTEAKKDFVVYNDASISEFELNVPLNSLPYGSAIIVGTASEAGNPISGTYGKLMFEGLAAGGKVMELPIYVSSANRKVVSQDVVNLSITFTLGSEGMHSVMESVAVEGTSVEAICKLFTAAKVDIVDAVTPAKGANGVSDNMVWRFVEGKLEENVENVVQHATIPGDILYWAYDDAALTFKLGTFNISKATKHKNFFMYTSDAITNTSNATHRVKGTDTSIWYYASYNPSDISGTTREARSPNLIIDSTATANGKDVGVCSKECWSSILDSMGAAKEFMESQAYGQQYVVKPFPSNTHKTYAIAPFVRNYHLGEYNKMVRLRIYNHPGPAVGSCVHFYASSAKLGMGDFIPDENYTARYIIVGKKLVKDATVGTGLLGKERPTNTSEIATEITMISNTGYKGGVSSDFKNVMKLSDSINKALQKENKK